MAEGPARLSFTGVRARWPAPLLLQQALDACLADAVQTWAGAALVRLAAALARGKPFRLLAAAETPRPIDGNAARVASDTAQVRLARGRLRRAGAAFGAGLQTRERRWGAPQPWLARKRARIADATFVARLPTIRGRRGTPQAVLAGRVVGACCGFVSALLTRSVLSGAPQTRSAEQKVAAWTPRAIVAAFVVRPARAATLIASQAGFSYLLDPRADAGRAWGTTQAGGAARVGVFGEADADIAQRFATLTQGDQRFAVTWNRTRPIDVVAVLVARASPCTR